MTNRNDAVWSVVSASYLLNTCHWCMKGWQGRISPALHWKRNAEHDADWQKHQRRGSWSCCHRIHSPFKKTGGKSVRKERSNVHSYRKKHLVVCHVNNCKPSEWLLCPALTQREEIWSVRRHRLPSSSLHSPLQKEGRLTRARKERYTHCPAGLCGVSAA